MAFSLFNHIQGKNGGRWAEFLRETGTENLLMVAIDAADPQQSKALLQRRQAPFNSDKLNLRQKISRYLPKNVNI